MKLRMETAGGWDLPDGVDEIEEIETLDDFEDLLDRAGCAVIIGGPRDDGRPRRVTIYDDHLE